MQRNQQIEWMDHPAVVLELHLLTRLDLDFV